MKKLLSMVAILVLFATSALADHVMYTPGNTYRDSGLISCSTIEASLKTLQEMVATEYLTYGIARELAESNNCMYYVVVVFTVNELFCKSIGFEEKPFTITKATIEDETESNFTILFTDSATSPCGLWTE